MERSDSIKNLAVALCKAQSEMGGAVKSSNNPFFKSKYSDLSSVVKAVKDPFSNNGLSYAQFPIEKDGRIGIETILMHESGEFLSEGFTVNLAKQDAQSAGSALTYCRRYSLQAVAGIPSEDDDGNAGSVIPNADRGVEEIKLHVKNGDAKYVKDNWTGLIASKWEKLDFNTTSKLNDLYSQQPEK